MMRARALLCLSVVVAGLLSGCSASSGEDDRTLTATFTDAMPIVQGNYVRASGVKVGEVGAVNLVNGKAQVVIDLDQNLMLHQDATALITANNLLGEKYIEIKNGTPSVPLMQKPYTIPVERTRSRVDVSDVVNSVDDPTGKALGIMLTSLGEGVDGEGKQAAAAIEQLTPSMKQVQSLSQVLNEHNDLLNNLIDHVQPVTSAVEGDQGKELDRLVDTTTDTLGAVAAQRAATADTLRQLPGTLLEARGRLAQLAGVADPTTDTLRGLRPVTEQIKDISGELRRFSDAADPALGSLPPVLDRGTEMLREARPVVHHLRDGGDGLRGVASSARELTPNVLGENLTQLMEFMKGWSLATSDYDAVSHYFKAIVPESPQSVGQGVFGPVGPVHGNPFGGLPVPAPPRPDLPGRHGGDSSAGKDAPRGPHGSATGLSKSEESAMLGQMLGGKNNG
jgi:phospholipid/cholesterol/gamma-HCH transport system substrate-binding protein